MSTVLYCNSSAGAELRKHAALSNSQIRVQDSDLNFSLSLIKGESEFLKFTL